MGDYRICHNTAPHFDDWWTVERLKRGWFGRWKWVTASKLVSAGPLGPITRIICHESREKALEWIAEDCKPRTRTYEEVSAARLCPCGKPSLPTASVCSGCADACAADGGEGDAPVAWQARIKPDGEWFHVSEPYAERRRAEAGIEMRPLFTRPTPATILTLLEDRQKMVEALEQIASRARSEVWPDHYAPEPPEWALDEHNEASTCGYCNAWLTVVRPGKSQCDCCADGQDLGAIARATLSALEETNR